METNTDKFSCLRCMCGYRKIRREDVGLHVAEKINKKTRDDPNIPVHYVILRKNA